MPGADPTAAGHALLAERVAGAADAVEGVPERFDAALARLPFPPRRIVTTGLGTSEGHARHLAELGFRHSPIPIQFVATGTLGGGAPPGCERDWLVVFSQGLSANGRFALSDCERWAGVVVVTAVSNAAVAGDDAGDPGIRHWLERLRAAGAVVLDPGCGVERGLLVRVQGARAGYAVAWGVLRSLAAFALDTSPELEVEPGCLHAAQDEAAARAVERLGGASEAVRFFAHDRALLVVAEGGRLELARQLALKLAEGMLRPLPTSVDLLELAHGPLQGIAGTEASILMLGRAAPSAVERDWLARLAAVLDPDRHRLHVLAATLPEPFSVLEYEAALDAILVEWGARTGLDLADWPGREREEALYARSPSPIGSAPGGGNRLPPIGTPIGSPSWEEAVWPEIEARLASGRRTLLVPLGSVEQHGPHLPLGTDVWIAQALGEALEARLEGTSCLPAIPFGVAREHLDFAGTLHIEPETLEAQLRDLLCSGLRHGFERAFVFSAHGGNVAALRAMRDRLAKGVMPLQLAFETDLAAVAAMQARAVAAEGLDPDWAGPHAGEFETSLVAALRPGHVRIGSLKRGRVAEAALAQSFFEPSLRAESEQGVVGDPTRARAGRGARYLEAWVELLASSYRSAFEAGPEKKAR